MYDVGTKTCEEDGCERGFKAHHWGSIKATSEGWFQQKDGTVWCPDHVPAWVAQWRARKTEEK